MNKRFEMFNSGPKNKPEQVDLPFEENLEELGEWRDFIPFGSANSSGERDEKEICFDGKKGFYIEGKKVSINEFILILGPRVKTLYIIRPELEERFKKLLKKESA